MSKRNPLSGVLSRCAKLQTKLVLSFLVLGVVPALALGWYSYSSSADQLLVAEAHRLEDAAITDGDMIDRNLFERYGDVQAFAANPDSHGTPGERQHTVDFLTRNYGIYDLMLIVGLDGRVMTANSVDGAGNKIDNSSLVGRSVAEEDWFKTVASGNSPPGGTYYTDVHSSGLVAGVYGTELLTLPFTAPILDETGQMVAVWHNEASFARVVSDIMAERRDAFARQGKTTVETQILRADGLVLDDIDPAVVFDLNLADAGLDAARSAVGTAGDSGFTVENNLRTGVEQVNGYAVTDGALGFAGYGWGVLVRQDTSEASGPATSLRQSLFIFAIGIVILTAAAGMWLARNLSRPLKRNVAKLTEVSEGDLSVEFEVGTGDEVGQMSSALNTALSSIGGTLAQVDHSAADLTSSASHLTVISQDMANAANDTSDQATGVASAAEEIAASSNSVARAMDQMSESVREISDNTADAARMTAKAVEVSTMTKSRMEKLDSSASDIGNVINVITSIAEQTDLLALNATIEAARVGEAGKGFAVVANEVKALAQQTSNATEEIQAKIEAIQADAIGAVEAIAEISELIDRVNETSTTIAGAVEEQSATTAEVSSSIQAMTDGTTNISQNIAAVAQTAGQTTDGAGKALDAAGHLSVLADQLSAVLAKFKLSAEQQASGSDRWSAAELTAPAPATQVVERRPIETAAPEPVKRLEDLGDELLSSGWR